MKKQNRLSKASSPYLQQHASNPVDWYEWGNEALELAIKENKPLLISIGYAACHWCHVMAHESFSNEEVAEYMNRNFVCIKVDREERPDIDQIYMDAAHIITGRGGWPLNAIALPDGRPFYAATYFPPYQWLDVLGQLRNVYDTDMPRVLRSAESVTSGISRNEFANVTEVKDFSINDYHSSFQHHIRKIDFQLGGYNKAPKFMMPVGLEFMLQYYYFTNDKSSLEAVTVSLDAMARGGLNDQIGGGFARYSTDERWLVPHFEKMLYDNAQLISLYAKAYQVTGNVFYRETAEKTIRFCERELRDASGGFYSSLDADSEHEEGKFYVFTKKEMLDILDNDISPIILKFYEITDAGNWEHGKNILHFTQEKAIFAKENGLSSETFEFLLEKANRQLFNYRSKRIRPTTDDKILCSWNALMISAYVNAYKATANAEYLQSALKTIRFIEQKLMKSDGSLFRVFKDDKASIDAFLDDYSLLIQACIDVYEVTFDIHFIRQAQKLTTYIFRHFINETRDMFYYTSEKTEGLIARKYETSDNVIPSSNSIMAHVLFRLGQLTDNDLYITISKQMLSKVVDEVIEHGPYYANWASLLGKFVFPQKEIVITGDKALEKSLLIQAGYFADCIFAGGFDESLPLLQNRWVKDKTLIYVCKDKSCELPVENIEEALKLIRSKFS